MAINNDRAHQMFPILTEAQCARIEVYGKRIALQQGDELFRPGEQHTNFYVLLDATLDITVPTREKEERHIITHHPGHFTGEINMFSARTNIVFGRVGEAGEALELTREQFRTLLSQDYELSEIIMRAFILRRVSLIEHAKDAAALVGSSHDPETMRVRQFMARNGHPFEFLDIEQDEAAQNALDAFGAVAQELPIVVLGGRRVLRQPSNRELGDILGISHEFEEGSVHDLVVVGAGPAGLAAAVYAASEGLRVIALEGEAWGGQAGSSSKIENYLGFPTGISGQALAARGYNQAQKFGAEIAIPHQVVGIDCGDRPFKLHTSQGETILASSVVIAAGAKYSRLPIDHIGQYEGNGVYYGATRLEAMMCQDEEVVVVGGGNSAGQAAVFLADQAAHVHLVVRREGLEDTMSRYLIVRIENHPCITMHRFSEVVDVSGEGALQEVVIRHNPTEEHRRLAIKHLFVMIGAVPNTSWLDGCVALDEKGFVKTGTDLDEEDLERYGWSASRAPFMVETSRRGIFAVGDVRSGSVKRVASAVGEGSIAVQFVHRVLSEG